MISVPTSIALICPAQRQRAAPACPVAPLRHALHLLLALLAAAALAACSAGPAAVLPAVGSINPPGPAALVSRAEKAGMPARLLAAADIGQCGNNLQPADSVRATAALLDDRPGLVIAAGDLAYPDGRASDFAECYDPAWGSVRSRTLPAPGNHEYHHANADGYFSYFGAQAGERGAGWYSVNFRGWHLVALNSNLPANEGSAQLAWLRRDLASRPPGCLLAFWHHPRFSSGGHGNNRNMDLAWQVLASAGADVVLNGHDHDYERFAPLDAQGLAADKGIREFVVGSGGAQLTPFLLVKDHSEVRDDHTYGILEIELHRDAYDWRFLGIDGAEFEDRGSAQCHQAAP